MADGYARAPGRSAACVLIACVVFAVCNVRAKHLTPLELNRLISQILTQERLAELEKEGVLLFDEALAADVPRGVAVALIRAPVGKTWKSLTRHEEQPDFLPWLTRIECVKKKNNIRHLLRTIDAPVAKVTLPFRETVHEEQKVITWRIETGDNGALKKAYGGWAVRPHGKNRCILGFRMAGEPDAPVPDFITDYFIHKGLEEWTRAIKKRVESSRAQNR